MFRRTAHLRHGNQRWLVGVPVNLFACIHQAWQMFWFVNDEQLQLAGMCWRTGAAILVSQDSVGLRPLIMVQRKTMHDSASAAAAAAEEKFTHNSVSQFL